MRNIVLQTQKQSSRLTTSRSGAISRARRLTRLSSVPTAQLRSRRGSPATVLMMPFGRADGVGLLRHLEAALGVHDHLDARDLRAPLVDHLGREAVVHRAVALPEQDARVADLLVGQAAAVLVGIPDRHLARAGCPCGSRCCGRGAGPGRRGRAASARKAQSSTARAFDEVQTAPPCSPHERLEGGGGVHVGDGEDVVARPPRVTSSQHSSTWSDLGHVGHRAAGGEVGQHHLSGAARTGCRPTRP